MKLTEIAKDWKEIKWEHSSNFEEHYEKALLEWLQGLKGKIKSDMKLYYAHYGHSMHSNRYEVSFLSKKVDKNGGNVRQTFPSAMREMEDGDYEVSNERIRISYNGAPMNFNDEMTHQQFLEAMQLVDMDISQLHDDPEIQKKLQARMKKEDIDDDKEDLEKFKTAMKDLSEHVDSDRVLCGTYMKSNGVVYLVVAPRTMFDEEEAGKDWIWFKSVAEWQKVVDDNYAGVFGSRPSIKLTTTYLYNIETDFAGILNDLGMKMNISALHSDPEVAKKLKDRQRKSREPKPSTS